MKECSKSIARRLRDPGFTRFYFRGDGIDIGGQPDPLDLYTELFPAIRSVTVWDREDGDARLMNGVPNDFYDFVHSSHCLEHLSDPAEGLGNWFRILKPGGFLIVIVPDEDLYEQGSFPSTFNADHKATFTIYKPSSWSDQSINVIDLLRDLGPEARIEKIELLSASYRFELPRFDQTLTPVGESGIEFIVRKADDTEARTGARGGDTSQPSPQLRAHLNQYRDDHAILKNTNDTKPPFGNTDEL